MSDFQQLLAATIAHLEELHGQGVRAVAVSPETMAAISGRATTIASRPVPTGVGASQAVGIKPSPGHRSSLSAAVAEASAPVAPSISMPSKKTVAARWGAIAKPATDTKALNALPPALPRAEKEKAMAALQKRTLACVRCDHLVKSRTQVVFGVGDIHSDILFIGEAPGADEDREGEPFVGAAGQLLTKIIVAMGLGRESVYIANILKCRPDTPGATSGNRKPTPEEMSTCIPYLHEQIDLIQPKAMVALGTTAVEGLLGKMSVGITQFRGRWQTFRGIPLMPTYHPAYLLRNQSLELKREVWEDMLEVMEKLRMPISAKQRGYFLKA